MKHVIEFDKIRRVLILTLCTLISIACLPLAGALNAFANGEGGGNEPEYDREWDRDMLPDEDGEVRRSYDVRVYSDENNKWEDSEYKVTDVRIIRQTDPQGGNVADNGDSKDDILSLQKWEDDDGEYGWKYQSMNLGDATLEVTYEKVDGGPDSYTFDVHVDNDVYEIWPVTVSGSRQAFPDSNLELFAFYKHRHKEWIDPQNEDDSGYWDYSEDEELGEMTIEWSVEDEESDAGGRAYVTDDPSESRRANLSTGALSNGAEEKGLRVVAKLKDGNDVISEGDNWINIRESYFELFPAFLEDEVNNMDVNDSKEITADVMYFDMTDYPNGLEIESDFTWNYDPERVSITDENGREIAEADDYNGWNYRTVTGTSPKFNITRLREEYMGEDGDEDPAIIQLSAEWKVLQGDVLSDEREYELNRKIYDFWIDSKDAESGEDARWKIYPDQQVIAAPTSEEYSFDGTGDYSATLTLGRFTGENDEFEELTGSGYYTNADDCGIKINGSKLYNDLGNGDVIVRAVLLKNGNKLADRFGWLSVCENKEEIYVEEEKNVLRGWPVEIYSEYSYHMENRNYPDGRDFEAIVTNAEITEGQDKLRLIDSGTNVGEDDYNGKWFDYETLACGTAKIKITYDVINREWNEDTQKYDIDEVARGKTHVMTVNIKDDLYEVYLDSDTGSNKGTPGTSLNLVTDTKHFKTGEDNPTLDGISYEWSIETEEDELEGKATIKAKSGDPSCATVTFGQLPDNWDRGDFCAIVKLKKGSEIVAEDHMDLELYREYYEIEPIRIKELEPWQKTTVTAALKKYPGGNIVQNVDFDWTYDSGSIEISDGTDNQDGSFDFTIKRLSTDYTDFWLEAEWTGDKGEVFNDDRWYRFDNCDYNIWFEDLESGDVFTDGDKTLAVNIDDFGGYDGLSEKGMKLSFKAGIYDWGNEDWEVEFSEGTEFSTDENTITLHGSKLNAYKYNNVRIIAEVKSGNNSVCSNDQDLWIRDPDINYNLPEDRDMLPNWYGWINDDNDAWVVNSQYPNGENVPYEITGVSIESQSGDNNNPVVVIDPKNENGDWRYEARNYGDATIKVTYKGIDGTEQEHFFTIWVGTDVYGVDVDTDDGKTRARPGDKITLIANAWHESENDSSTDGITYDWQIADFNAYYSDYATLTPDPRDASKATLRFKKIDDMPNHIKDGEWEDIRVEVVIFDGKDGGNNPIERARGDIRIDLANDYMEVAPYKIDRRQHVGTTQNITTELRLYGEEYSLKEAHFRWYYNSDAIEIRDANGNVVGNNYDGTDEYVDSEASYGIQPKFTIKRLRNSNERFEVKVDVKEQGSWREVEMRDYWFDELDYNIWFENDHKDVDCESGPNVSFKLEKSDELKAAGDNLSVVYEVGEWDGDNNKWAKRLTVADGEYELTANGLRIYKNKALARGIHDVGIRAVIKQGKEELRDTWAWLHIEDHVMDYHSANPATCESDGTVEYWSCDICGKNFADVAGNTKITSIVDPAAHIVEEIPAVAATCTSAGKTAGKKCSVCGEVIEAQKDIPALGHDYHDVEGTGKDATCTEDGRKPSQKCSRCNATKVGASIPALGHDYGDWVVTKAATCTEKGAETRTCKLDSSHKETREIAAKGHTEVDIPAVAATCTSAGKTAGKKCSVCGEVLEAQKDIPALGHDYGDWAVTKAATTAAEGMETRTCKHDSTHTETRAIAKLPAPGSDPKQKGKDGTAVGEGASAAAAEAAITSSTSDEGPKGSKYATLTLRSTKQGNKNINLTWTAAKGAKKYVVYGNACGKKNKMKKLATVTGKTYNVKKVGKKLKKGTYHKFMVVALDKDNNVVSTSKVIHVATKGNKKKANPTKVTVKKPKTLKKGKTFKLGAKQVGKNVQKHRGICYESSNPKVATVNSKGKITAKKKGKCYVYAYAQNGVYAKVKVAVK